MFRVQILIILLLVFNGAINAYAAQYAQIKSSLVTGATPGLGRYLAETLSSTGHHVYAGARTDQEMAGLNTFKAGEYLAAN